MLTIWGARQHFCDRLTRRHFLALGAFGAGLSLANLLRARAAGTYATRVPAKRALDPPSIDRGDEPAIRAAGGGHSLR